MLSTNRSLIRTQQADQNVNGIPTQVVCTEFSNYMFIVVTQYGKVGTLISVTPESRTGDATMISSPAFSTRVLLGKDEALTHVCAKYLVSQEAGNRPVLLALSLRDSSLDSVRQMRDLIRGMVTSSGHSEEQAEVVDLDFCGEQVFGKIEAGVGADIGADIGADVGVGADIGVYMGDDMGVDMYMGADIRVDMGGDMGVDIGADGGADLYMGADIGANMGDDMGVDIGADRGADMYMGVDMGVDVSADRKADLYMGADIGADMYMGDDIGEHLAVEDCPPLGATPAPLLLREPPIGLFT